MCSCGKTESHIVATRRTMDNIRIHLWSDGDVTGGLGITIDRGRALPMAAARSFLETATLFSWEELPALLKHARKAIKHHQKHNPNGPLHLFPED